MSSAYVETVGEEVHAHNLKDFVVAIQSLRYEQRRVVKRLRSLEAAVADFCNADPELTGWKTVPVSFRVGSFVVEIRGVCGAPEITITEIPNKVIAGTV